MRTIPIFLLSLLVSSSILATASEGERDSGITTIKTIDMEAESPTPAPSAGHSLLQFDVSKMKVPGAHAHAILRQLQKRVRAEFESSGLPKGRYALAWAETCSGAGRLSAAVYKKRWHEIHRFQTTSTYIATEKSMAQTSLRKGDQSPNVLEGKALALFHVTKDLFELIDCKLVKI